MLDRVTPSLSRNIPAMLQRGANGNESSHHSLLVSLSIEVTQTGRLEMLNGIIAPLSADPLLTFCAFSVILFKMLLSEWNKSGSDPRFWGLCTIIIIIIYQHHTLWSGVIWGNSKVRSSRPQMMAGIKVTGLWMAAQSLHEFTPVWYFLHLKKDLIDSKMLLLSLSFYLAH